jgi:flagellin
MASASMQGTAVTGAILGNGDLTINGVAVGAAADDAKSVAASISAVANVAATASTSVTMGAFTAGAGGDGTSTYTLTVGTTSILHTGATVSLADLDTALSDATVQANLAAAGITTTGTFAGTDMTFIDADGDDIDLAEAVGGTVYGGTVPTFATLVANTVGSVAVTSTNEDLVIAGTGVALAGLTAATTSSDPAVDQNVLTVADASSLITAVDTALDLVNSARGTLGAIQNRFESVVTSLQISTESLSAARSRIQDTDFAAETANLTKAQILQQAGIAMIAQANSLPQNVLSLLQ